MSMGSTVRGPKTLFESLCVAGDDDEVILFAGAPGHTALQGASDVMMKATHHRLKVRGDSYIMQYGPELGERLYLQQLALFLSTEYSDPVSEDNLVASAGATNGLNMILQLLYMKEKPIVFIEEFSYHLAFGMLKEFTEQPIVPVALNKDGIDVGSLEMELKKRMPEDVSKRQHPWALLYCIPTFHNPTGRVYSSGVCERVVELARLYNMLVVCDDVYNMLYYDSASSPKRLISYDSMSDHDYRGHVISNGSFSKLLGPGLRVGWIEGPAWFCKLWKNSAILISGGAVNNYTAGIIGSALELNLVSPFVANLRHLYKERKTAALDVLRSRLPSHAQIDNCEGGYFIWIELPDGYDAPKILEETRRKHRVWAVAGNKFTSASDKSTAKRFIRIAISYYDKEILVDAMKKMCSVINEWNP